MPLIHLFKIKAKKGCNLHFSNRMACNPIYKIHLEPMCPLFWHVNLKKLRPFLTKGKQRGRLGSMPLYYTLSDVPDVPSLWSFPVMLAGRARPIYLLPSFRIPSLRLCQTSPSSQIKVSATSSSPVTDRWVEGTHVGISWSQRFERSDS